jgi:hypothetical protein
MRNHSNFKILIHIFTIIFLIMIIIIMRGENFVAHLDGLGDTPVAHHCTRRMTRFSSCFMQHLATLFHLSKIKLFVVLNKTACHVNVWGSRGTASRFLNALVGVN